MSDKKQVIYDMERCICNVPEACMDCSHYTEVGCMESLMYEALDILKEQGAEIERLKEIAKNGNGFIEKCDSRTAQMFSH